MHLFVTGGTGFFGKALLRHWSSDGAQEFGNARFTLLSRDPVRFRAAYGGLLKKLDAHLVAGDIQRPETLPEGEYTHVLHAATDSTMGLLLTPLQRFNQIVDGTRNVLDLAVRSGHPRVLLTSSGGVYGGFAELTEGVPEDHHTMPNPLVPQNAYSIAKRQAEHMCALYHDEYGLDTVIARCFAFVGEDLPLNAHFAIGNFIRDALAGRPIVIQGDGTPVRSYLDQRDLARWLMTLLGKGKALRAYNVGSTEAITISALAQKVAALTPGNKPKIQWLNQATEEKQTTRNFYLPNIERARTELGLRVEIDLDTALRDMIRAKSKHPKNNQDVS
jgi:dTDP-glucose 4,6-dehydratase